MDRLVDHGVKALVIAVQHRVSAAVLHDARERYDVPVVEVIRPAVRRAAAATRNSRVGVISTAGHAPVAAPTPTPSPPPRRSTVTSQPCPRFVEFVERGVTGGPELLERRPTSTSTRSPRRASTRWSSAAPTTRC